MGQGKHHELTRQIGKVRAVDLVFEHQLHGPHQAVFPDYLPDPGPARQVNIPVRHRRRRIAVISL